MKKQKHTRFAFKSLKFWSKIAVIAFFILTPFESSLADWDRVQGNSMYPTILDGDLIDVDTMAYDFRFPFTQLSLSEWSKPQRGDIITCFSPKDSRRLVKRIIGLPGDTIELISNIIFINGIALNYSDVKWNKGFAANLNKNSVFAMEDLDGYEHLVMGIPSFEAIRNFGPVKVPIRHYFVLGDNRDNSKDSRDLGFIKRTAIIGKVKSVMFSSDKKQKNRPRVERIFADLK